ncbi:Hypothetical predicted protein [Mytilus galloprovincialis]|nr:Hypothetical predicted protein [Mytilus galloprovincialis]
MFMIEIAGVKVLYTGDFSRQEDRHLMQAEIPNVHPDILIVEATYGTHIHEKREDREARFTGLVHDIVSRGGRCLIPVFALGRAQELLLILDEYWSNHPELHDIPIYYASSLAKKCMTVYQTYINAMNDKIKRQISISNPFVFKHISNLKSVTFDNYFKSGISAMFLLLSFGQGSVMLKILDRENWRSGQTTTGCSKFTYCVNSKLNKRILEPRKPMTSCIHKLHGLSTWFMNSCDEYLVFSNHCDVIKHIRKQIIRTKLIHCVLVHGEQNEMSRLKAALVREYEDDTEYQPFVHNPRNTVSVELNFRGEKMAKVVGKLAADRTNVQNKKISGILLKRNFNYHILDPSDLSNYTDLAMSTVTQRISIGFTGTLPLLRYYLQQLSGDVEQFEISSKPALKVFKCITVVIEARMAVIEWMANPVADMYADAVMTVVLRAESDPMPQRNVPPALLVDKSHVQECLLEMLTDMFGSSSISKLIKNDRMTVTVDDKTAVINVDTLDVACEDETLQQVLQTAVSKLFLALSPLKANTQYL